MTAHGVAASSPVDMAIEIARPYRTLVAAGVGGMCGVVVGFPFDTMKTKMQTYGFATMRECSQHTWQRDGARGFYRGILPPLGLVTVLKAVSFQTYEFARSTISTAAGMSATALPVVMTSGAASGIMAACVGCPFDLIKVNMQVARMRAETEKVTAPLTSWSTGKSIVRANGVLGLYLGLPALVIRDGFGTAVYFAAYEGQYRLLGTDRKHASSLMHMCAGGFAGMASWVAIFPVDLVKSRVQKDALSPNPAFKGLVDCAKQIYRQNGMQAFYRGLFPTLVRAFPIHAVNFLVYERMLQILA